MAPKYLSILLLLTFSAHSFASLSPTLKQSGLRCGNTCKFRFCRADGFDTVFDRPGPRLLLRDPNVASQPFVCARVLDSSTTQRVKILSTRTAMVYQAPPTASEPFVNIRMFSTNPRFPRNYFGLTEVSVPPIPGEVGIFRSTSGGAFEKASDDLCVKIPIRNFNVVKDGKVIDSIRNSRDPDDCISFRSVVPKILVEATWNSDDDFDVSLQEPQPGELIDFSNTMSAAGGRLNLDQNVARCGEGDLNGREQIRYLMDSSPLKGEYTATLTHFNSCGPPTDWSLAVIVDGVFITQRTGTSSVGNGVVVTTVTFTI